MSEIERIFREGNLHDLVEFLAVPGRSGLYLTRARIRGIAAEMGLRTGVQSRARMLETLFREAGSEGRIDELLERLDREAAGWLNQFRAWERACPHGKASWKEWTHKLKALRRHLSAAKRWCREMREDAMKR